MLDAFALAIIATGGPPAFPGLPGPSPTWRRRTKRARRRQAAESLCAVAPTAGSYVSESNYLQRRLAQRLLGPELSAAAAVKGRYDPDGLFTVHHGVGSEAWSPDGFTRVA